jgi:hypothetical protein
MLHDTFMTDVGTPPAYPGHRYRQYSDRAQYALAIFNWCRAHPASTAEEFLAMIDRAESRVATERVVSSVPEWRRH